MLSRFRDEAGQQREHAVHDLYRLLRLRCWEVGECPTFVGVAQDILSGTQLDWFYQLERTDVHNWEDLAAAFYKQY